EDLARRDIAGDTLPVLEDTGTHARHIGRAQAGAGMVKQALHRALQDIGGDLQPEIAGRAAVASDDAADGDAALPEHLDMVTEAEDDAFQRCAPDMGEAVV